MASIRFESVWKHYGAVTALRGRLWVGFAFLYDDIFVFDVPRQRSDTLHGQAAGVSDVASFGIRRDGPALAVRVSCMSDG